MTIEHALDVPAAVVVDVADNSALPAPSAADLDGDGAPDACDNCFDTANANQLDLDYDGTGDLCDICPADAADPDDDLDTVCDPADNCPGGFNPDQADADADSFGPPCDCDDGDAATHPGATEINDGVDQNCPGDAGFGLVDEISGALVFEDAMTLSWPAQDGALRYQILRDDAVDFADTCDVFLVLEPLFSDADLPPPGGLFHYLVRSNFPNLGSWGAAGGQERTILCAP